MEVQRPRYLNRLIDKKDNGRVKIIHGQVLKILKK